MNLNSHPLASAHAELEQSLREQLGAACESKERLEEELKSLASANAAAEEAKMVTERLNQSLREQLDVLSKERAELGERLLRREEELSAEGRTEKDVDESMSGMQTSSDTDDRDEVLELLRVEIVRLEQELAQALNVAQLMKRPDDEGAPGDGENPVQDTSNVSTNSDSIVETMKRDISRLERELAEALAELDSISYSFESASTVGATEFTQALNSARSEVTRLSNELEELEQRKQQALTESSERNESQLASLASAHAELEQSLREQLGAACESKERLEEELKSLASANAAAEEAKMVTERLNQSLREQLDVLSKERAELGERLLRREEELSAEGRTEKDVDESMSGMQTSSDTDDRDEVLELLRVEIVRLERELAQALNVAQLDAADDVDEAVSLRRQLSDTLKLVKKSENDRMLLELEIDELKRSTQADDLVTQIEELRSEVYDLTCTITEKDATIDRLSAGSSRVNFEDDDSSARIRELEAQIETLTVQSRDASSTRTTESFTMSDQTDMREILIQYEDAKKSLEEALKMKASFEEERRDIESKLEASLKYAAELESEKRKAEGSIQSLEHELNRVSRVLELTESELENSSSNYIILQQERDELQNEIERLHTENVALQRTNEEAMTDSASLQIDLRTSQKENRELMDKIAVLNDEHNAIERAALGRTQELEAERDGLLRKLDDLATLEAVKRALEGRVSDRDAEIACETKCSPSLLRCAPRSPRILA